MTVLTRRQFRQHWEGILPGLGQDDSALWIVEEPYRKKSRWFLSTRAIDSSSELMVDEWSPKKDFWLWCNRNCAGQILCYSSSAEEEWWGFSHHADIVPWMLKWSR